MTAASSAADLHKRIDDLERKIEAARSNAPSGSEHRRQGDAMHARARGLREKLSKVDKGSWEKAGPGLHDEFHALDDSVSNWMARLDRKTGGA